MLNMFELWLWHLKNTPGAFMLNMFITGGR